MTKISAGRPPLTQLLKQAYSHPIVQWPLFITGQGHFTCFTNTQDITYTIETGRKKNKQTRTLVSPKRKKREIFGSFQAFCASVSFTSVYSNKNPHTATRSADSSSRTRWPGFWVHMFHLLAQQSPFSDHHLSLTVTNSYLLLTALGPCLSSSSSVVLNCPDRAVISLFIHHSVTACQSTRGH